MNNKFKVGDRVKGYVKGQQYRGVVVEVNSGVSKTSYLCRFYGLNGHYGFNDTHSGKPYKTSDHWYCNDINRLEYDDSPNWKVVIIPDGDKTIGKLIENGKTVKQVTTKKHPDDKYDMNYAIKVVTERLVEPKKEKPKLYNGKVVCVDHGNVPEDLTVGKIYEFVNGNCKNDRGGFILSRSAVSFSDLDSRFGWTTVKFIEVVE